MALIFSGVRCAICCELLGNEPITATSGVCFAPPHPLYHFCDAPFHVRCVDHWEYRVQFSKGYYESYRQAHFSRKTLLIEGDKWFLGVGPATRDRLPYYFQIAFSEWPQRIHTKFENYGEIVRTVDSGLSGAILETVDGALKFLRSQVPDNKTLCELRILRLGE
jgi:hypothetical protein